MIKSPAEVQAECATAGIATDDTIYLYCFKGARASNTFLALKQAGFDDVRMYFGSLERMVARPGAADRERPAGRRARSRQLAMAA